MKKILIAVDAEKTPPHDVEEHEPPAVVVGSSSSPEMLRDEQIAVVESVDVVEKADNSSADPEAATPSVIDAADAYDAAAAEEEPMEVARGNERHESACGADESEVAELPTLDRVKSPSPLPTNAEETKTPPIVVVVNEAAPTALEAKAASPSLEAPIVSDEQTESAPPAPPTTSTTAETTITRDDASGALEVSKELPAAISTAGEAAASVAPLVVTATGGESSTSGTAAPPAPAAVAPPAPAAAIARVAPARKRAPRARKSAAAKQAVSKSDADRRAHPQASF